jgi:hypothetical protein
VGPSQSVRQQRRDDTSCSNPSSSPTPGLSTFSACSPRNHIRAGNCDFYCCFGPHGNASSSPTPGLPTFSQETLVSTGATRALYQRHSGRIPTALLCMAGYGVNSKDSLLVQPRLHNVLVGDELIRTEPKRQFSLRRLQCPNTQTLWEALPMFQTVGRISALINTVSAFMNTVS